MILHYHWENVTVNVPYHPYGSKWVDQHTKPCIDDVDFDYEVDVSHQDIIDFLTPRWFEDDKKQVFKNAVGITLCELDGVSAIDYEQLENNDVFVEFMKERYEKDAIKEFEAGNEAY